MQDTRKIIYLVDDNITNLTAGKNILSDVYSVFTFNSGERLLKMLAKAKPDLILLDVEMPEMNGYDIIKIIKADSQTSNIPVIFLTAKTTSESELMGLSLGAVDYISKPLSPPLLLKRIEMYLLLEKQRRELQEYNCNLLDMVSKKTKTIIEFQGVVLKAIAELVEYRDDITGGHIERTREYLRILTDAAVEQNVYKEEILSWDMEHFLLSSLLHDVGKIAIRDTILRKPGRLTDEEYNEMKTHTTYGVNIIERIKKSSPEHEFLDYAAVLVGSHHEKWDGSGYPHGLLGDCIPLQGRLMAIADVYDALVSVRPYKKAYSHEEAVSIIMAGKGSHFDPSLVDLFILAEDKFKRISA